MAFDSYGPFDSGVGLSITQAEFMRMARAMAPVAGVVGDATTSDLVVTADGTSGLVAAVAIGDAWLDGTWGRNTAAVNATFGANASGQPRIDRVVARRDASAKTVALAVLAGTPASSPTAPALTQTLGGTYELSLAQVRVESGATNIAANKVTDERIFTAVDYRVVRTVAEGPAPRPGAMRWETSTGALKINPGAGWVTVYDPATDGMPIGAMCDYGGTSDPAGWFIRDGRAISRTTYATLFAVIGTSFGAGDGSSTFNIPDTRDKTVVNTGPNHPIGQTGGSENAIAVSHSHPHAHGASTGTESADHSHGGTTATENQAHTHNTGTYSRGVYQSGGGTVARDWNGQAGPDATGGELQAHNHNFSTGGRSAAHTHAVSVATDSTAAGLDGTGANLSPYVSMPGIIKHSR